MSDEQKNGEKLTGIDVPYMPLWVRDFMFDDKVLALPGDMRALYLLALVIEWTMRGNGLPIGAPLARHLDIGWTRYKRFESLVISVLFREENGRLFNDRLETELRKAQRLKKAKIESGRKGGRASKPRSKTEANEEASQNSYLRCLDSDESKRERRARDRVSTPGPEDTRSASERREVFGKLTSHPWNFGRELAADAVERGMTLADVAAWDEHALAIESRAGAVGAMKRYARPSDVPADPARKLTFAEADRLIRGEGANGYALD